jgi:hypothetical protein
MCMSPTVSAARVSLGRPGLRSALRQARLTVFALVCFCTAVPQPARLSMPWYVCRRLLDLDAAIRRSRLASAPSCACQDTSWM